MRKHSLDTIDALLPQTQCGLCGYGGCMPYAEAMAQHQAPLNLCPPGGVETLLALGQLFNEEIGEFVEEMREKTKPSIIASIREAECIGCTKCITACPVDAIIGSAKSMHTVLTDLCTGCELCIPPCPVDCIDMQEIAMPDKKTKDSKRQLSRQLFIRRNERLQKQQQKEKIPDVKNVSEAKKASLQSYVAAALSRAATRK